MSVLRMDLSCAGALRVDVDAGGVWLRFGYSDGAGMPNHWRSAYLDREQARIVGQALLREVTP